MNNTILRWPNFLLRYLLTALFGWLASIKIRWLKNFFIWWCVRLYQIDPDEIEHPIYTYTDFNAFFIRKLKAGLRPVDTSTHIITAPVDGYLLAAGHTDTNHTFTIKQQHYTLNDLYANDLSLVDKFSQGFYASLYLAPNCYHRFHLPCKAKLIALDYYPGELFSVKPHVIAKVPKLLARNERVHALFETPHGLMSLHIIGALCVKKIFLSDFGFITNQPQWPNTPLEYEKGAEFGYFQMGSSVLLCMQDAKQQINCSLQPGEFIQYGRPLASFLQTAT